MNHGGYHKTLIGALSAIDAITESPWWATDQLARICHDTGKPVAMLTLEDLQRAWAQVGSPEAHPEYDQRSHP